MTARLRYIIEQSYIDQQASGYHQVCWLLPWFFLPEFMVDHGIWWSTMVNFIMRLRAILLVWASHGVALDAIALQNWNLTQYKSLTNWTSSETLCLYWSHSFITSMLWCPTGIQTYKQTSSQHANDEYISDIISHYCSCAWCRMHWLDMCISHVNSTLCTAEVM